MIRILVIEDEPSILENLLELLALENYQTIAAENGQIGVQLAREHLPDLIICDIMMPALDGYGVLLELRGEPATSLIPFIFLTARADKAAVRTGMDRGADDYLTKPFTPTQLLTAITARLERANAIRAINQKALTEVQTDILQMLPHELRTPLTAILGYSDMLATDAPMLELEQIMEIAKIINRSGLRLNHLVENFLMAAQVEIISQNPEWVARMRHSRTARPGSIIESSVLLKARDSYREDDLHLSVEEVPAINIPEDSLKKIVTELVDNAFKFSKRGTPVEVRAAQNDGHYRLVVSDQGRGMTPQQITDIGFYRQFERQLYEQQGSGLGLTLVKGITTLYGGEFHIESAINQGTAVSASFAG